MARQNKGPGYITFNGRALYEKRYLETWLDDNSIPSNEMYEHLIEQRRLDKMCL
jgi:hypothetical protein